MPNNSLPATMNCLGDGIPEMAAKLAYFCLYAH